MLIVGIDGAGFDVLLDLHICALPVDGVASSSHAGRNRCKDAKSHGDCCELFFCRQMALLSSVL